MLNIRTHKPLMNHWNLYYVELNKFLKCSDNIQSDKVDFQKELEQWSYFLGTIQDNSKPIPPFLELNHGIKEVFEMLQTFTKDDRLREQYRLHEEFLRVQRGEEARKERLKQQYKMALQEIELERKAKEAALKKNEEILIVSVLSLKKAGYSSEKISEMLNINLTTVESISESQT